MMDYEIFFIFLYFKQVLENNSVVWCAARLCGKFRLRQQGSSSSFQCAKDCVCEFLAFFTTKNLCGCQPILWFCISTTHLPCLAPPDHCIWMSASWTRFDGGLRNSKQWSMRQFFHIRLHEMVNRSRSTAATCPRRAWSTAHPRLRLVTRQCQSRNLVVPTKCSKTEHICIHWQHTSISFPVCFTQSTDSNPPGYRPAHFK